MCQAPKTPSPTLPIMQLNIVCHYTPNDLTSLTNASNLRHELISLSLPAMSAQLCLYSFSFLFRGCPDATICPLLHIRFPHADLLQGPMGKKPGTLPAAELQEAVM